MNERRGGIVTPQVAKLRKAFKDNARKPRFLPPLSRLGEGRHIR